MLKKLFTWFEVVGYSRAAAELARQGLIEEARECMRQHKAAKETIKELNRLSDKELQDIGITRGEIHSIAYRQSDNLRAA